jgi:hypothetical protein
VLAQLDAGWQGSGHRLSGAETVPNFLKRCERHCEDGRRQRAGGLILLAMLGRPHAGKALL